MCASIPTLGYQSRTEAVMALSAQGLGVTEISRRIGIPPQTVGALKASGLRGARYRHKVHDIDRLKSLFSRGLIERLSPAARRRGCTVEELIKHLVEKISEDDLVDAVMDDGEA